MAKAGSAHADMRPTNVTPQKKKAKKAPPYLTGEADLLPFGVQVAGSLPQQWRRGRLAGAAL